MGDHKALGNAGYALAVHGVGQGAVLAAGLSFWCSGVLEGDFACSLLRGCLLWLCTPAPLLEQKG